MDKMVHEDYKELLALSALDALEDADVRDLDAHLASCEECRAEFDELRDASGLMAYAANQLEPSAVVRSRILESVRTAATPAGVTDPETPVTAPSSSNVIPLKQKTRRSFAQSFGAIAAALILVAVSAALLVLWSRNASLQREVAQLSKLTAEQQEQLQRQSEATALLTAKDTAKFELAGTPMAQKAHAMLAFDRKTGHAMLMVDGLPKAPEGMAYQLWFIAGGQPMPGKVFNLDASGKAMMVDDIPAAARDNAVFAVTLEPKGGVTSPTGQMYLMSAAS